MTDAHEVSTQLSQMSRGPADPWRSQDLRTSPDDEAPTRRALATAEARGEALPPPGPEFDRQEPRGGSTMPDQAARYFLQTIRGAGASILWALQLTRRPMTNRELQRYTRYGENSLRIALHELQELGCLTAVTPNGPWVMSPQWASRFSEGGTRAISDTPSSISETYPSESGTPSANRAPSRLSTGGGGSSSSLKPGSKELPPPPDPGSADSADSAQSEASPQPAEPWNFAKNLEAAREAEIEEPGASRIAALRRVTPAYIRLHVKQALAEGRSLGAAVYRIEHGWPVRTAARSAPPEAKREGQPRAVDLRSAPYFVRPEGYEIVDMDRFREPRAVPPKPVNVPDEDLTPDYDANLAALLEWRGAETAADRIAALPHVTPFLIREHYRQAYQYNQDVMTALFRIEHNEPLPETWIHGPQDEEDVKKREDQLAKKLGVAGGRPSDGQGRGRRG